MRVARLIERLPPAVGGKEVHGAELTRALAQQGVEQVVFAREGIASGGAGVRTVRVGLGPARRLHSVAAYSAAAMRAVEARHRVEGFDLVHAHGDFHEALAAANLSRRLGVSAVLSVHGGLSRSKIHSLLRLGAFSAMETVLPVSESIASQLVEGGVSSRITVRSSGVRDVFFRTARAPRTEAHVVCVGRLARVKGVEMLLAARDALASRGRALHWTVVAGGEDAYARGLRAQIEARSNMRCVDGLDAEQLAVLLSSASAVVLPSIELPGQHEGVPTALLEAIAAQVPVVASRTGGMPATLGEGDWGLLVKPGDAEELSEAVKAVHDQPTAAAERARRASASGVAQSWSEAAAQVLKEYEGAVERHRRQAAIFALPWFDIGGAEYFALGLARGWARRGVRTCVAAAPGRLVEHLGEEVEFAPLRRLRRPSDALTNAVALAGVSVRLRPQAINSHHLALGVVARAGTVLARGSSRHVLTIHTTENPHLIPVAALGGALLFHRVSPVASTLEAELLRWVPPGRRGRFDTVRAGVDPAPVAARRPRTVGFVGRFVGRKGHRVLLAAWAEVAADRRADGWSLELWGDGPEFENMVTLADELKIADRVVFSGAVERAAERVGEFELVVQPSLREGLPLVLLEAMTAGCAVIATDIPGCRELLDDGRAGRLVPSGDSAALAAALLELIDDGRSREAAGAAGRARVEAAFTRARQLNGYGRLMSLQAMGGGRTPD